MYEVIVPKSVIKEIKKLGKPISINQLLNKKKQRTNSPALLQYLFKHIPYFRHDIMAAMFFSHIFNHHCNK